MPGGNTAHVKDAFLRVRLLDGRLSIPMHRGGSVVAFSLYILKVFNVEKHSLLITMSRFPFVGSGV